MKIKLICLIILSLSLYSCGNSFGGFDPRAYNSKPDTGGGETGGEEGGDIIIPDDDPFDDHQNPNVDFEADKFNDWSFRVTGINGQNVPSYKFESDRTWTSLDTFKGEYSHSGGKIGDGLKEINGVTYYRYKSKNPMFPPDDSYNTEPHGDRMERFYFYRFTGKATMDTKLDNYVIAVDTYTKLIFAYAVPTKSYPPGMGYPNVPTAWGSVDKNVLGPSGIKFKFYEYDPVGYVSADGSVTMYTWFYNILATDNYDPIIDTSVYSITEQKDRAIAKTDGSPGRSPYFYLAGDTDLFLESTKTKEFSLRDTDEATPEDSLILHTYKFSLDGKSVTYITEKWLGNGSIEVKTFTDYNKVDKTSGRYGSDTFELREEGTELYKNNVYVGTVDYNTPPDFRDRVKGATFKGNSKDTCPLKRHTLCGHSDFTITFSDNGNKLNFHHEKTWSVAYGSGNGDYTFQNVKVSENRPLDRALYDMDEGGTIGMGSYGFTLYDNDTKIWKTSGVDKPEHINFGTASRHVEAIKQ